MDYIIARCESICIYSNFVMNVFKVSIDNDEVLDRFLSIFNDVIKKERGAYLIKKEHESKLMRFVSEVIQNENTAEH